MSPPTKKNAVNPLSWDKPIVNPNGTPTPEFMRKWQQQAVTNEGIPKIATAQDMSRYLDLIGSTVNDILIRGAAQWGIGTVSQLLDQLGNAQGDILYRSATGWTTLPPGAAGKVLTTGGAGANPSWTAASGGSAPNGMLPLVTGELPGPVPIADGAGQYIGVPL